MNDEALELIQTKIAFLEQAHAELSDVVFRQHLEIRTLEAQIKEVSERLVAALSADGQHSSAEERPPHY